MAIRILVVDDEPLICQLLSYQLSGAGYEVRTYQNGQQALLHLSYDQPDLVLLDVMMPGISGWDICRQIRACSTVPVIMLTAKQADDDVVAGLNCGADDYIGKPFSERQLIARIEAVLRRANPSRERTPHAAGARPVSPRLAPERATGPSPQHLEPPVRPQPAPPASPTVPALPRLGTALAEARQTRGMSLHQAERACGVRWEFLQAIEQEQFGYMPRTQLRTALHAYSNLLGVELRPYLGQRAPRRKRPLRASLAAGGVMLLFLLLLLLIVAI